jgi:NADPH2:quinone reductase
MRAVWLREFGGPEVLTPGEAPDPVAGPGQVVVDVEFANTTFVETQVRAGRGPFAVGLPTILGNGVGGVVVAVGAGVGGELVGARVITGTGGSGGYAERVAVDASAVFVVPEGMGMDVGVALLADGRTATMMTRAAALRPGDRVLVEAAAGGVGSLLVQLAGAAGARVVAAAGGARKVAVASGLGAEVAVDYTDAGWATRVREAVGAVDVVFDGVGGEVARTAFGLLDSGGRMVSFGLASGSWAAIPDEEAAARGVTLVRPSATPEELRRYTESALAEARHGRLRPVIGQRFPLGEAAAAHAAIGSRATVGKTLLVTGAAGRRR